MNEPWRAWYTTKRWRALREKVLAEAGFVCERTGEPLIGVGYAWNAPVVDHIVPHEGDERLFWERSNLQAVCKRYHDAVKQAREKGPDGAAAQPKWLQPTLCPLTIVAGPAGSGKTTWARTNCGDHGWVIDLDDCAAHVSGEVRHDWDRERWLRSALWLRNYWLGELSGSRPPERAVFVMTEPAAARRAWWASKLGAEQVVVMEVTVEEIERRGVEAARVRLAADWWRRYERRDGERRIG